MKNFYTLPQTIKNDIEIYSQTVKKFLKGEIHPTTFRAHRVPFGVYEQRESNTYMMRIRVPAGGITPAQMVCMSTLGKQYGNAVLHVTTRQDIQIHRVKLEDTPLIMEALLSAGLSTKGGGGNTVRNITACPDAGVCKKERFDVSPYAIALTEHMIKDPRSYTLPRKFKVAFSGCPDDCSFAMVNDVGFVAVEREINGRKEKGFKVYVAGGMGFHSRIAEELEGFIPESEVANVCDAIKNLFDKNGNRKNKHKARLRFLLEALGKDDFIQRYAQELTVIKKEGGTTLQINSTIPDLPTSSESSVFTSPVADDDVVYFQWFTDCVSPQNQKGYYTVKIITPLGEISAGDLASFATLIEQYGEGTIRATHDQNLLLRWVQAHELRPLYKALHTFGQADDHEPVRDIVCCAGSSTCRLGICLSKGLADAVSARLKKEGIALDRLSGLKMKISGCPNACGQHPIAKIGFFGAARRAGEHLAPYYMVLLGGRLGEGQGTLSENIGLAHVKDIPDIVSSFCIDYIAVHNNYVDFYDYLEKQGKKTMKSLLDTHATIPSYEEDRSYYHDWGAEGEFSLAGRGAAECGAGVFDIIEVDLDEAEANIKAASESEQPAPLLYEAINRSSRALLVTRGVEVKTDLDAHASFEKEFISSGFIDQKFLKLMIKASEYKKGNLRDNALQEEEDSIKGLVSAVKSLYNSMDDTLQFTKTTEDSKQMSTVKEETVNPGHDIFDLRGVACPFNYVKAKLKLEMMNVDDILELYLDEGEPINNVPNSLKNDGQEILKTEKLEGGYYSLLLKKKM